MQTQHRALISILATAVLAIAGVAIWHDVKPSASVPPARAPSESAQGAPESNAERPPSEKVRSVPTDQRNSGHDPLQLTFTGDPGKLLTIRNLQEEFPGLAAKAAKGDLIAARTLFYGLGACGSAPTYERLQQIAQKSNHPSSKYAVSTAQGKANLDYARSWYAHCGELTSDQRRSIRTWTALLADAGDSQARLGFADTNQPEELDAPDYPAREAAFQQQAKAYVNAEINDGNTDALLAMANGYSRSPFSGQGTPFGIDPEMAYAYGYAYGLTTSPAIDVSRNLAGLEEKLTPEQIKEAESLGTSIYQGCCH